MSDYIDFHALGQVLLVSVLAGAGLVAVFSVGLVGLSEYEGGMASGEHSGGRRAGHGGSPLGLALALVSFAIVLGVVGLGLWTILHK